MKELQPSLEESIVLALFDLVNHMSKNGERMAAAAGLTVRQWIVLLQVAGDPNFPRYELDSADGDPEAITASYIAAQRGVTRANIGSIVATLLEQGLIEQTEMEDDRRRKRLSVTAEGRERLQLIESERRRANRALFGGRDRDELVEVHRLLLDCLARLATGRLADQRDEGADLRRRVEVTV